jgi:hypothetical protein
VKQVSVGVGLKETESSKGWRLVEQQCRAEKPIYVKVNLLFAISAITDLQKSNFAITYLQCCKFADLEKRKFAISDLQFCKFAIYNFANLQSAIYSSINDNLQNCKFAVTQLNGLLFL